MVVCDAVNASVIDHAPFYGNVIVPDHTIAVGDVVVGRCHGECLSVQIAIPRRASVAARSIPR
jgi:hypothetical protein